VEFGISSRSFLLVMSRSPEAQTIQVIHGRLRSKVDVKIAADTIGIVKGLVDQLVQVQVTCLVGDKDKSIVHTFKPTILEPQKEFM
jgi:hypothetical protein